MNNLILLFFVTQTYGEQFFEELLEAEVAGSQTRALLALHTGHGVWDSGQKLAVFGNWTSEPIYEVQFMFFVRLSCLF